MASAVVVERGPQLFLVRPPPAPPAEYPFRPEAGPSEEAAGGRLPASLVETLRSLPTELGLRAGSEALARALGGRLERTVPVASLAEMRAARAALPSWGPDAERRYLLSVAHESLERALRSPEEVLITLTREEERVERAVGREARASESFLVVRGSPLAVYARQWTGVRASLEQHHSMLETLLR
ncbi:MAG: hypothetical protein ACREDE_03810, partial [Thermoplasmata archaeon]